MTCIISDWKLNKDGYGYKNGILHHRKVVADHLEVDVKVMGGVVMHSCDNPACINIVHLTLGTQQQNVADQVAKGRTAKGTKNGQCKLTMEQVQYIRDNYVARHPQFGGAALARLLGVMQPQISRIVNGKKWGGL